MRTQAHQTAAVYKHVHRQDAPFTWNLCRASRLLQKMEKHREWSCCIPEKVSSMCS